MQIAAHTSILVQGQCFSDLEIVVHPGNPATWIQVSKKLSTAESFGTYVKLGSIQIEGIWQIAEMNAAETIDILILHTNNANLLLYIVNYSNMLLDITRAVPRHL